MFFTRFKYLIIIITVLVTVVSIILIPRIKIEFDFLNFSLENDPDLKFYRDFSKKFTNGNDYLMVAVFNKRGIFDTDFLNNFNNFTNECKNLPLIKNAGSVTTMKRVVITPFNVIRMPFIHLNNPLRYESDSIKLSTDPLVMNWLISKDYKTLLVLLEADSDISKKSRDKLITALDKIISKFHFDEVHIAGNINLETRYIRMIGKEITINIILCTIILIIFLWLIFRSRAGVLVPFLSVLIAMIIFYGYLGLFHKSLNILSTLFPTIMLVVGVSNLIRIYSKYEDTLDTGFGKAQAISITVKELWVTLFLTSATTAIGFFSLTTSSIRQLRNFGIDAGIGVIIAFIVGITFTPAFFVSLKSSAILKKNRVTAYSKWNRITDYIFSLINHHPVKIIYISIIIFILSAAGLTKIDTNTYRLTNFSESSQLRKDALFFENNLSGTRSFEIAIQAKNSHHLNELDILTDINKVETYLSGLPDVGVAFSPATVYKTVNRIYNYDAPESFIIPENMNDIEVYDNLLTSKEDHQSRQFISSDKKSGRIIGWMKDNGTSKAKLFRSESLKWIQNNTNNDLVRFRHTGTELLSDKDNDYLIKNMILNLGLAFFIVSIIMGVLFKDFKMVIISLIPNVLPLIFLGGLVGYTGIIFNAPVSIIFTIGFVIAVDDTIHFLSKFRLEYNKSNNIEEALHTTIHETGKPMCITSFLLILGFLVLIHSQLKGVFYQAILVSTLLFVALIADLLLTPALVKSFWKRK